MSCDTASQLLCCEMSHGVSRHHMTSQDVTERIQTSIQLQTHKSKQLNLGLSCDISWQFKISQDITRHHMTIQSSIQACRHSKHISPSHEESVSKRHVISQDVIWHFVKTSHDVSGHTTQDALWQNRLCLFRTSGYITRRHVTAKISHDILAVISCDITEPRCLVI